MKADKRLRSEAALERGLARRRRSEAAIKKVINQGRNVFVDYDQQTNVVQFYSHIDAKRTLIAEIDLRALIKRRAPLTGARKALNKIVRGGVEK